MKKFLALFLVLALMVPCFAIAEEGYEIALVTDVGNIDDKSFNQSAWEGVKEYAEANAKTYAYYRPSEDSDEARIESIKAAIDKGAKVIVLPGFLFEAAAAAVQNQYPEVTFVLLDTAPAGGSAANTYSVLYCEEQAGYFAGYAAVKDGYTELGFLGGIDVPAVVRFGYGFVQGADDAAAEMGVDVNIKYWYSASFAPTDEIKTKMDSWFADGTEVVFACGGGIYLSALAAAEAADGVLIGVDKDQSFESELIITSAMKNLTGSVVLALTKYYDNGGKLPEDMAGAVVSLGVADNAVGLPTAEASWRLETFTVEEYNALYAKVQAGEIEISNAIDVQPAVEKVVVDYQN